MLVKMQRPLFSSDPSNQPMLVYSRDRSFRLEVPMTPEYAAMFEEYGLEEYGRAKLYADVTVGKRGGFEVNAVSDGDMGW